MRENKILITGGCGFIGAKVIAQLVDEPFELFVIDNLSSGKRSAIPENRVTLKICDIRSEEAVQFVKQVVPDYVIHLAAQIDVQTSLVQQQTDADINIMGTLNMIRACQELPRFKKFVFASSAAVYGNNADLPLTEESVTVPTSPYGVSKLVGEQYLALNHSMANFPYCALRFANVYGDKLGIGKDVISNFSRLLKTKQAPAIYGNGEQTRDFIYVDDIANALIFSLHVTQNGVYNISTNEQTSINDVLHIMNDILSSNIAPEQRSARLGDIQDSRLSNEKFVTTTCWKPKHSLRTGLECFMKMNKRKEQVLVK
ncbi:NAD-dependent epimerase/dehydratase family protein [Listeria booriae]|uniref:NAD-dependent epimerase/dehydratase family protein n=1 Tax=Listeria booriae TaxID=1552123 RepID=UPI001624D82A|nr:NAD-dependent epimerase/dehydratase family protein [Listeria booriae]MBC2390743.1 NAD-dependent epimerase/dehydratase family protein [Listeria booriae]